MISLDSRKIDGFMNAVCTTNRIPGAALAITYGSELVFARGYGFRDLQRGFALDTATAYPIGSTTKAINTTLLALLVEEGILDWDAPVRRYVPEFDLYDADAGAMASLRDLVTMRTGLPRHDWAWEGGALNRAELMLRVRHLQPSAPFRARFQYNNITATLAGHVAERVTGRSWEALVQQRILTPLAMRQTVFTRPASGNVTLAYHENRGRHLVESTYFPGEVTAPSGGAVYSTIEDMARWAIVNLNDGRLDGHGHRLIEPGSLPTLFAPQVPLEPGSTNAGGPISYAMGWFVDTYGGQRRIAHGGYHHDVLSDLMLFPDERMGLLCFINFGPVGVARAINQTVFDIVNDRSHTDHVGPVIAEYERKIADNARHLQSLVRSRHPPTQALANYAGVYSHPGYGDIEIRCGGDGTLAFKRRFLEATLDHVGGDVWTLDGNAFFEIHMAHPLDGANPIKFETDERGEVTALTMQFEMAVAPIRFSRQSEH